MSYPPGAKNYTTLYTIHYTGAKNWARAANKTLDPFGNKKKQAMQRATANSNKSVAGGGVKKRDRPIFGPPGTPYMLLI